MNHQCTRSRSSNSLASLDYEVAELTWENGQLAMYGVGPPRAGNPTKPAAAATWAADTLESIVDQAAAASGKSAAGAGQLVPWLDHDRGSVNNNGGAAAAAAGAASAATASMDALVPCGRGGGGRGHRDSLAENATRVPGVCTVGSCSGAAGDGGGGGLARGFCASYASGSPSDSLQVTLDSCDIDFGGGGGGGGGGLTSTSLWSPENTSSGEDYTKTSGDDHDAVCRSRSQRQAGKKGNKKLGIAKSSVPAKVRAAAIHNQSERRRRDKINERMKTLQKLVPNSSKTDKASMLDEVIDYMKQLQAQVHMMSRMNMPSMNMMNMMPLSMQQQLQMSMMTPPMGMGMGMGMPGMGMSMHGMGVMDINGIGARAGGMPPMMPSAAAAAGFMSMPQWDVQHPSLTPDLLSAFFASQSQQPMTIDSYTRLAALHQQFQQTTTAAGSKK